MTKEIQRVQQIIDLHPEFIKSKGLLDRFSKTQSFLFKLGDIAVEGDIKQGVVERVFFNKKILPTSDGAYKALLSYRPPAPDVPEPYMDILSEEAYNEEVANMYKGQAGIVVDENVWEITVSPASPLYEEYVTEFNAEVASGSPSSAEGFYDTPVSASPPETIPSADKLHTSNQPKFNILPTILLSTGIFLVGVILLGVYVSRTNSEELFMIVDYRYENVDEGFEYTLKSVRQADIRVTEEDEQVSWSDRLPWNAEADHRTMAVVQVVAKNTSSYDQKIEFGPYESDFAIQALPESYPNDRPSNPRYLGFDGSGSNVIALNRVAVPDTTTLLVPTGESVQVFLYFNLPPGYGFNILLAENILDRDSWVDVEIVNVSF